MTKQADRPRNNIFGSVLTDILPASNYRGDVEDNRSVLQKLRYADGDHTVFSAEAIRSRLRDMLREDDLKVNRKRLKNKREITVRYEEFPDPRTYADDKLFGFLALSKEKAEFQGDSVLRMNYAVSVDPFPQRSRQTMHQSPEVEGGYKSSVALIYREVHVSAFQYPFAINLNDLNAKRKVKDGKNTAKEEDDKEQTKQWRNWAATLLRAIGELNGVAGNHARVMFPFGPVSIVLRLTARRTPDFNLYGFKSDSNESQHELLDELRAGRLDRKEFYIGGRIVREYAELKELADARENGEQKNGLGEVKLFNRPENAIEELIKDAKLEEG